MPNRSQI